MVSMPILITKKDDQGNKSEFTLMYNPHEKNAFQALLDYYNENRAFLVSNIDSIRFP